MKQAGKPVQEWVRVYHGSINNASVIRAGGLDPLVRADRITDSGIVEAQIPKAEFDAVLSPNERVYYGFNGSLPGSSEIVLRTSAQAALFNRHIVR